MKLVRPHIAGALLLPAVVCCAGEMAEPTIVLDSAGITIVANPSVTGREWTLASEPFYEVGGGMEPEVPLLRITAVAPQRSRISFHQYHIPTMMT